MIDIAIRAEGLGKRYRLGEAVTRRSGVTGRVAGLGGATMRHVRTMFRGARDEDLVWALRDVSFELERGKVLGIIGRNGAGKSTLLKILSRVSDPTTGSAAVYGSLSSLLEVGTGFHGDLSGRDNVYLNGAILGMRRNEIARKFDEIVEFAGVEKYIDTPVKRYSSGMYMRLAFAVAAHLEPDILVVDEVLAVGDAEFQRKSLGKMREVTGQGRTVLFVSHNMASIRSLCHEALLLEDGVVADQGHPDSVITRYLNTAPTADSTGEIPEDFTRVTNGEARLVRVRLLDRDGRQVTELRLGQPFTVEATVDLHVDVKDAVVELGISSATGGRVATAFSVDGDRPAYALPRGRHILRADVDVILLPGSFALDVGVHHTSLAGYTLDYVERVTTFEALNFTADSGDSYQYEEVRGYVRPTSQWHTPEAVGTGSDHA
ncbi:MAG TPA: ABC transporter ATP-binding protein [Gaiellaceae bacterium]